MQKVYLIENLTNAKYYIGQTRRTLEQRLRQHISDALHNPDRTVLGKAIYEHGAQNFKVSPLVECATLEEANQCEKLFIWALQATDPNLGYNVATGGRAYPPVVATERTSLVHRERWQRDREMNPEKLIARALKIGAASRGRKASIDSRMKMSESAKVRCARNTVSVCPRGHSYSGDNLQVRNGKRYCRKCISDREKIRAELRKKERHLKGPGTGAWQKAKTHCPKGHPYSKENTVWLQNGKFRRCRQCKADQHKAWRANYKLTGTINSGGT